MVVAHIPENLGLILLFYAGWLRACCRWLHPLRRGYSTSKPKPFEMNTTTSQQPVPYLCPAMFMKASGAS